MNIHSVMALNAVARRSRTAAAATDAPPGPKRDAILRAAIDVFAERGFFNAQVADVARAAGVAAGTVYLYFRSKDDLLVSIFERSMRDGLAEGRAAVADLHDPRERLLRLARGHLARLGRDRNLAIVFQVELRQSTKFMERFSATLLRDYLGPHPRSHRRRPARGRCSAPTSRRPSLAKMLFGALDEMATNWILSRRRYSLEADADVGRRSLRQRRASDDDGADDPIGRRCSARARWARRSPRTSPTPACRSLLLDLTADAARDGLKRARALKPDPFFTPDAADAHHDRRLRRRPRDARRRRLDHRGRRRAARRQARAARARRRRPAAGHDRQLEHVGHSDRRARRRPQRRLPARTGSARTSSTRRATCASLEVIPTADTDPAVVGAVSRTSPITASARASSSRRTRRTSSRNHIGALRRRCRCCRRSRAARYTIEEIDAITGPALGRPKSATFRTMDIAGVDILAHVARNLGLRQMPRVRAAAMVENGHGSARRPARASTSA